MIDVKNKKPEKGQILAKYSAMADFVDDWLKRNVVTLLTSSGGADSAMRVMRNVVSTTEIDSIRVPLAICQDLAKGESKEKVWEKPYRFHLEKFFWATKDEVPKGNIHWTTIELLSNIK